MAIPTKPTFTSTLLLAALTALALSTSCASSPKNAENTSPAVDAPPPVTLTVESTPPVLRVAAEWEPALGVMVRWPASVPKQLFVEIASDSRLYVLVEDDSVAADATEWFTTWSIAPADYEFLTIPGSDDSSWTRDYGPHPIFTANGGFELGDARYDMTTPESGLACDDHLSTPWNGGWGGFFTNYNVEQDDAAPTAIANALGIPARELPFSLTGGNFITDGRGSAISTCILTNENTFKELPEKDFFGRAQLDLGINQYQIIPNFETEGIQHIDCLLKMLDEERLLVARPPSDHALFDLYQNIVDNHLTKLRTPSGQPYEILRLDTARYSGQRLAAYTNSLILNDVVYVPLFDIEQDEIALATWSAVLPGHTIKGIRFALNEEPALAPMVRRMYPDGIGWRSFDALHCRTRAVWDPEMLYISVDRIEPVVESGGDVKVSASIVAYSGEALRGDQLLLFWRYEGDEDWQQLNLERGEDGRFHASMPIEREGAVEYFVFATDESGRAEYAPRTAPDAAYRFVASELVEWVAPGLHGADSPR